jgi:hypothetical protein
MAASPPYKCYDDDGVYQASTKDSTLAAAIMACLPEGARVKFHGRVVWVEGRDGCAADSYDNAALVMDQRIEENQP